MGGAIDVKKYKFFVHHISPSRKKNRVGGGNNRVSWFTRNSF